MCEAFLYGPGAMGTPGVTKALEIIHRELDLTMAFCAIASWRAWIGASCCRARSPAERALGPAARKQRALGDALKARDELA